MPMNKNKILIISQYFYPEQFRINDLALEMKQRGYDVTVLTGLPNYPKGDYYEGYLQNKNCDEKWNGIPVYRCNLRARKSGSINLIRNYISFIKEATIKLKDLENMDFDLIYVFEVSPITVALPAIKLKKKRKIPIIMNVQDLWPENIIAVTGISNSLVIGCINRLVKYIYENCNLILTASKSFVPNVQNHLRNNKEKVIFWPQYAVISKEEKQIDFFNKDDFNIVFTGNIGKAQGLDLVIEAAKQLKDTKIKWQMIGDGREEESLKQKVREYQLENTVIFHGRKPESEIPQYLANADAALLILKPNPVFEMTIPAKLQTYMACGVPIIGCVSGEGKRTIDEAEAGIVSNDISVDGLINACCKMMNITNEKYEQLCINSINYGISNFNKENILNQLFENIERLTNESI